MREKRLKLFLYDVSINYGGRIEITDNLLLLLNTFIGNISSKEELQRFLLVFNHEKTDDGYCKVKYLTKELIEANDSLENKTIESILNGISNEDALEVGILASNFLEHMYSYCYMMSIPTLTKKILC